MWPWHWRDDPPFVQVAIWLVLEGPLSRSGEGFGKGCAVTVWTGENRAEICWCLGGSFLLVRGRHRETVPTFLTFWLLALLQKPLQETTWR